MASVKNPILPGFHPDSSICRAGDRYYLVNSTFSFFPGVPIYESRDLGSWRQIGNVLTRDSQLPVAGAGVSDGVYAPTLRFHDGVFYMITTIIHKGNFYVTATDPAGPWSEPVWLDEALGIDPSLFFDDDGSCWYVGQREREGGSYNGDCEIWLRRLDLEGRCLTGPEFILSRGFQRGAIWPEGPHIYKKDGWYYLLHAEGGTAFHHSVMVARSRRIEGPYEYNRCNPILTHRHLGAEYPVTSVGHGDLVEDGQGNWYMVMLACRPDHGCTLLGRETFLAKVTWEEEWPVVNAGLGRLEEEVELPTLTSAPETDRPMHYRFDAEVLPPEFLSLRNHREEHLSLRARPGFLRLSLSTDTLRGPGEPSCALVRVRHKAADICCELESTIPAGGCAGLVLFQNEENHVKIGCLAGSDGATIQVVRVSRDRNEVICSAPLPEGDRVSLRFSIRGLWASAWVGETPLCWDIDLRPLSTELAGGFVGCTAGMFAEGDGTGWADFRSLAYVPVAQVSV